MGPGLAENQAYLTSVLRLIAEGTVGTGSELFESIASHLALALGVEVAVLGEIRDLSTGEISVLALHLDGRRADPSAHSLHDPPFDTVNCIDHCVWPEDVRRHFPHNRFLKKQNIVSFIGRPIAGAAGEPVGLIAAMSRGPLPDPDLAEEVVRIFGLRAAGEIDRLHAESRLQRSEEMGRIVLESSVEGICGMTAEGILTLVNRAAAEMLGYEADELLGTNFFESISPPMGRQSVRLPSRLSATAGEGLLRRKIGKWFPVEYVVSPMQVSGRPLGWVVSFLEVTQRRKLEVQLEQANRLNSLGHLAASVAHEFNNVLMAIQPFAEVIERQTKDLPRLQKAAFHIQQAIQRGKRITSEILRYARPIEIAEEDLDCASWAEALAAELKGILPSSITVELAIETRDLWIRGDKTQLEQVFINLAKNAGDAMGGKGTLTLGVRAGSSHADFLLGGQDGLDHYVHFTLRDEGAGIAPADMARVFEPFFTTKREGKGTGLGLAITQRIIAEHGGKIFVESQEELGTTFHLLLPAVPMPALEAGSRSLKADSTM